MTRRAGIDIGPFLSDRLRYVRLCAMALQAGRVSVLARRDREANPLLGGLVASRTVGVGCVLRVVEFSVEGCKPGKLLHRPGRGIGMADGAHLAALRIFEMGHVAARARGVVLSSGETHSGRRPFLVFVAKKTRQARMRLVRVGEFRIIDRRVDGGRRRGSDLRLVRVDVFRRPAAAGYRIPDKGKNCRDGHDAFHAGRCDPGGSE